VIPQLGLYGFSATESEKIIRLPLFNELAEKEVEWDGKGINLFYK